jgi:Fic family protein
MQRGLTGHYVPIPSAAGEQARAFVPNPLPPAPPLDLDAEIQERIQNAMLAVGRLDGLTAVLPDPRIFLYSYVRKEAVLSSQIEGTQSSLSDLLLFEMDGVASVPVDDVQEVSNYVAAMNYGLKRLQKLPLSLRLLKEIHSVLMKKGRGSEKEPGEFRRSQNWLWPRTRQPCRRSGSSSVLYRRKLSKPRASNSPIRGVRRAFEERWSRL